MWPCIHKFYHAHGQFIACSRPLKDELIPYLSG
jgi:hypothetical protein